MNRKYHYEWVAYSGTQTLARGESLQWVMYLAGLAHKGCFTTKRVRVYESEN